MNCHSPCEAIHIGSETDAGCHDVPDETWNDGRYVSSSFMGDISCGIWHDDGFWAAEESARSNVTEQSQ